MPENRDVVVTTAAGRVRGVRRGPAAVFYGVPYAEPPVGELAFLPPVRRTPWHGVRDATVPGPTAQHRGFTDGTIPEPSVPGDDVLTVNVFTPDPSRGAVLPVLVWLHGGAYIAGSPVSPWYDGGSFCRDGVVVVTVGYRLGVAGFGLVHDAPANRAVHDWLAALEWVRENVADFGGDPGRVTVAGQSAGGGAVLTLLGVDRIGTLAQRAIAASPVVTLATPGSARRAMAEVAGLLGVEPTTAGLRDVHPAALADAVWEMRNVFGAAPDRADAGTDPVRLVREVLTSLEFSPVLDDDLVRTPLVDAAREATGVPLLIGSVAQEFNGLVPAAARGTSDLQALELLGASRSVAAAYLGERSGLLGGALLGQALTDLLIRASVARIAEGRAHTWVYDFTWRARGDGEPSAFHCLDLPFAWGTTATPEARRVTGAAPPRSLIDGVHEAWTSFVTTGAPGWNPFAPDRTVRSFDVAATTEPDGYRAERLLAPAARSFDVLR